MSALGRVLAAVLIVSLAASAWPGEAPVALRAEHFVVPPSTGPVTHVVVRNLLEKPYQGTVRLKLPGGWRADPAERAVTLKPGETKRVPFSVQGATNVASNAYAVEVAATGGGATVVRKQEVVCASAPYFKPKIDGRLKDWDDAIPVTFTTKGKRTVVRTFWNKRQFCLAVEVEEDALVGYGKKASFDAVQFALAASDATTGAKGDDGAARYEFVVVGGSGLFARARCFALMKPGDPLDMAWQPRKLTGRDLEGARTAVKRRRAVTQYECAIPSSAIPGIRLTVGREIRFSLLVHDPNGTGLRDLGQALGLWPSQRTPYGWSQWHGAQWDGQVPFDSKIEWGLCSSKR